ncbi:MAG: dephospho-CoA kinase [Burkholderiaceae bacterium]|nr:dephospho-CoA kinase [Burkholderiaceae bacterium]
MTLRIALTGGIGSGKSTLAKMMVDLGAGLIDLDAIARELTSAGGAAIEAIRAEFGDAALGSDGALDRAGVRARVFADASARAKLEALLHPIIWQHAEQRAAALEAVSAYLLFDVPLLAENPGESRRFDRVLLVDCPAELQIARVLRRGGMPRAQIEAIIAAQASRERRLELADDVVFNGGDLAELASHARRLHARYGDPALRHAAV